MLVGLDEFTCALKLLNFTLLSAGVDWKLLPEIVTTSPTTPIVGEKLLITGADPCPTVNEVALVADPFGLVMLTGPVVAPEGTTATILVAVEEATVAAVPLN
jgi:hypothetical protein